MGTEVCLCLPAPQDYTAFQELLKSLAVIPKFTVEIVNEKSFRFADALNTAVQERQVMPVNQDVLEDFKKQFWNLKSLFNHSHSELGS